MRKWSVRPWNVGGNTCNHKEKERFHGTYRGVPSYRVTGVATKGRRMGGGGFEKVVEVKGRRYHVGKKKQKTG